jgi:hypothetical protein
VEAAIAPHFVDQGEALATVIGRLEPNDLRAVAEFLEGLLDAGS